MSVLRRQKFFTRVVTFNFIVFCILIAPSQFYLDWLSQFYQNKGIVVIRLLNAGSEVMKNGFFYFYAIILCFESFFRLNHFPGLGKWDIKIYLLKCFLFAPFGLFIIRYFESPWYEENLDLSLFEKITQITVGVVAFLLSLGVHFAVTNYEKKRIA